MIKLLFITSFFLCNHNILHSLFTGSCLFAKHNMAFDRQLNSCLVKYLLYFIVLLQLHCKHRLIFARESFMSRVCASGPTCKFHWSARRTALLHLRDNAHVFEAASHACHMLAKNITTRRRISPGAVISFYF